MKFPHSLIAPAWRASLRSEPRLRLGWLPSVARSKPPLRLMVIHSLVVMAPPDALQRSVRTLGVTRLLTGSASALPSLAHVFWKKTFARSGPANAGRCLGLRPRHPAGTEKLSGDPGSSHVFGCCLPCPGIDASCALLLGLRPKLRPIATVEYVLYRCKSIAHS